MIDYPDNVQAGDVARNHETGEVYDVFAVAWRTGHGWVAHTRTVDGYNGPTFYPHPDRMPSPDLLSVSDLLMGA